MIDKIRLWTVLFISLSAITASACVLWVTTYGPGISPDSIVYIETAESIQAGEGFYYRGRPMTLWPPAYPLFLAASGVVEKDALQAGRMLHALLFGVNVTFVGLAVYHSTRRNLFAVVCAILIFLSSRYILEIHFMAWSEPLFISLMLAGILFLSMHIARPRFLSTIASSICLGGALATRYVGVILLPMALIGLLFLGERPTRKRIGDVLIALILACTPLGIWIYRNAQTAGTLTGRTFAFHPVNESHFKDLIHTMFAYALNIRVPGAIKTASLGVLFIAIILGIGIVFQRNHFPQGSAGRLSSSALPVLNVIAALIYLLFIFIYVTFFDVSLDINFRTMSPVFILLMLALVSVTWNVSRFAGKPAIGWVFSFLVLFSVIVNGNKATAFALHVRRDGLRYASRRWLESETIAFLRAYPSDGIIYSNGPDIIGFMTGKKVRGFPRKVFSMTSEPNQNYNVQLRAMCEDCRGNKALVVYLNGITWLRNCPTRKELESICRLPLLGHFADGFIYGVKSKIGTEN